jgi:protein-S-isoprenylcysteine O-methyltransferase Ste14
VGLGQSVYLEHPAGYVSRLSLSKHPCIYTPCRDCLGNLSRSEVGQWGAGMAQSKNGFLPTTLYVMAGIGVLVICCLVDSRIPVLPSVAKLLGVAIVLTGGVLVFWSARHLGGAFHGAVKPRTDELITSGPYRFVRHPVYLGMTIALIGLTIAFRSWLGLLGVFLFFLPSEVYRAKLEERALESRFRDEWDQYKSRTGFMLPVLSIFEQDSEV